MIRRTRKAPAALLGAAFLGAVALAGCETGPRHPLYSSVQTTGSFGWFDEDLGRDRVRVGYRAPIERASTFSRAERRQEADRLVNLSYDLALLRAAEIAAERGAPSFDIDERENNVDLAVHTGYAPDPFYPPWPYWHRGYHPYPFYGPAGYVERYSEVAVSVTFVATLHDEAGTGGFDTAETLARLRSHRPEIPS